MEFFLQVILLSQYLGVSIEKAVSMPRVFVASQGNDLYYDESLSQVKRLYTKEVEKERDKWEVKQDEDEMR